MPAKGQKKILRLPRTPKSEGAHSPPPPTVVRRIRYNFEHGMSKKEIATREGVARRQVRNALSSPQYLKNLSKKKLALGV